MDDVIGRICTLETSLNPKGTAEIVDAIKRYAARYTHMCVLFPPDNTTDAKGYL